MERVFHGVARRNRIYSIRRRWLGKEIGRRNGRGRNKQNGDQSYQEHKSREGMEYRARYGNMEGKYGGEIMEEWI